MTMEDLATGLKMFNEGVQQYAVSSAISNATQHVQELNASAMDENQKRAEQMQIANQLAAKMAGLGATGAQLQAVDHIAPAQLSTPEDYFKASLTASNPESAKKLASQANALQQFQEQPAIAKQQEISKAQQSLEELKSKNQLAITKIQEGSATTREREKAQASRDVANTKVQGQLDAIQEKLLNAPQKAVPTPVATKLLDMQEHQSGINEMIDTIQSRPDLAKALVGNSSTSMKRLLGDEEAGVMLQRLTTLRSQMGKTLFGLRENQQQMKSLQQIVPNLDMPPKVFLAEMHKLNEVISTSRMNTMQSYGREGFNTGAFADVQDAGTNETQQQYIDRLNQADKTGKMSAPFASQNTAAPVLQPTTVVPTYEQYINRSGKIPRR